MEVGKAVENQIGLFLTPHQKLKKMQKGSQKRSSMISQWSRRKYRNPSETFKLFFSLFSLKKEISV